MSAITATNGSPGAFPRETSSMSGHDVRHHPKGATRLSENGRNTSQKQSYKGQHPPSTDNSVGEEGDCLFSPIPECSWKCARARPQKTFIGRTKVDKIYEIPWWWPKFLASTCFFQAESMLESKYIDPRYVYREVSDETSEEELPPREEYVVLGIFGSKGSLLHEEVVYIGKERSKHLYRGLRHLFQVPILREITSFGLYKCDQENRIHVRVDLNDEDKDRLHSLFDTITTWSRYHSLRQFVKVVCIFTLIWFWSWWIWFPFSWILIWWIFGSKGGTVFYEQSIFCLYYHFGSSPRRPEVQDEDAWCDWLQENLNKDSKDPSVSQYSIEVIVGWSRERILDFVVQPFVFFLCCTTGFALVWSFSVGAHHSNVAAGFSIASYFAGLAGASVALIGFFGGSLAYK